MKTRIVMLVACAAAIGAVTAQTIYVSPDVPTDPALGSFFEPFEVLEQDTGAIAASPVLSLPGSPVIDGLHRMDKLDNWLVSLETPSDLGGALGSMAEPRDVIRVDGGSYSLFFCGASVADPLPTSSNIDALYQTNVGGDAGDLILSFDVPTTIGGYDVRARRPGALPSDRHKSFMLGLATGGRRVRCVGRGDGHSHLEQRHRGRSRGGADLARARCPQRSGPEQRADDVHPGAGGLLERQRPSSDRLQRVHGSRLTPS